MEIGSFPKWLMKLLLEIDDRLASTFMDLLLKEKKGLSVIAAEDLEEANLSEGQRIWLEQRLKKFRARQLENVISTVQRYFQARTLPVDKVWLFGSFARSEQTAESDVDLLIRFSADSNVDLWDYAGILQDLEDLLGIKVDLAKEGKLRPGIEQEVDKEKILIYERKAA